MVPELAKLCAETPQRSLQRELQLAGLQCLTTLSMHDRVKAPIAVRGNLLLSMTAPRLLLPCTMRCNTPPAAASIAFSMLSPIQSRVPSVLVPCDRLFQTTNVWPQRQE